MSNNNRKFVNNNYSMIKTEKQNETDNNSLSNDCNIYSPTTAVTPTASSSANHNLNLTVDNDNKNIKSTAAINPLIYSFVTFEGKNKQCYDFFPFLNNILQQFFL
jgi:hypothetical protein